MIQCLQRSERSEGPRGASDQNYDGYDNASDNDPARPPEMRMFLRVFTVRHPSVGRIYSRR